MIRFAKGDRVEIPGYSDRRFGFGAVLKVEPRETPGLANDDWITVALDLGGEWHGPYYRLERLSPLDDIAYALAPPPA